MRISILASLLVCLTLHLSAKDIPLKDASNYAVAAYKLYAGDSRKSNSVDIADHAIQELNGVTNYYLFNIKDGGFVIISGDDRYYPVLGFSSEDQLDLGNFHALDIVKGELSDHERQIAESRKGNLKSTNGSITQAWSRIQEVAKSGIVKKNISFTPAVAPLTTTKWNQDGFYNASCPADPSGPEGRTYCGCLPVALGQLLKYYENPAPGNGALSYQDRLYGTQDVDICGRTFDYDDMPDVLTEPNSTLADFIYDVGKITRTQYSTVYTGTYVSTLENALVYNFGFDANIKAYHGTDQARYSEVLRKELDEGRIVFLSGWSIDEQQSADIGHTWLADGYGYTDTGLEYMHFNWGWGGNNNGWFLDVPGSWTPHADNPQQVSIPYYWYRYTVYNIQPSGEDCSRPNQNTARAEGFDGYAYLYYSTPMTDELRRYRYREVGTDEWTTSEPTDLHYSFAGNLKKGTDYEYQVSRNCCGGWSSFSSVKEFRTLGTAVESSLEDSTEEANEDNTTTTSCAAEAADRLSVTSVSDNFGYVYTTRPHGQVDNQFRYKKVNSSSWTETDISTSHFRALSGLDSGTTYEYQVRHQCEPQVWSDYSNSFEFSTTGVATAAEDQGTQDEEADTSGEENADVTEDISDDTSGVCPMISTDAFAVGLATSSGATAYLLRLTGGEQYRFRYRMAGSEGSWSVTAATSSTYSNFTGLSGQTSYEVQISQFCEGGWSEYSESLTVTTL